MKVALIPRPWLAMLVVARLEKGELGELYD